MPQDIQKQANSFFGSEYRVNVLERISQVEKQTMEGAREGAPVILGREAFVSREGAKAAYKEALTLYNKRNGTVDSELLARYASSYAGKEQRFKMREKFFSNPVAMTITIGILIPVVGLLSAIPLFLRESFKVKEAANKAKDASLAKYPDVKKDSKPQKSVANDISKENAKWTDKTKQVKKTELAR
ncbi:MAG: hypothetical protein MK137_08120 [Rickettsiales bacterium]|nr:hypothetical protein [Rickettsiales bacterium]